MFSRYLSILPNGSTSQSYNYHIRNLLGEPDVFLKLAKSDKSASEDFLLNRVVERRNKVRPTTLKTDIACAKSFLDFEEVSINWKKVKRAAPTARMIGHDRPPTVEEIRRLLNSADKRMRSLILIMVSGGIRIGAFYYLHFKDYRKMDNGVGRLRIYDGEPEEYVTFITPEAINALEDYFDERRRAGENLTPDSPLIREVINWRALRQGPITPKTRSLEKSLHNLWLKCALKLPNGKGIEVKTSHGFRKFFKTRAETSMRPANVELLMGHNIGVSSSYYKPQEKELIEDYLKAIPDLTISETEELRKQNTEMQTQFFDIIKSLESRLNSIELERLKEKAETIGKTQ